VGPGDILGVSEQKLEQTWLARFPAQTTGNRLSCTRIRQRTSALM